MCLVENAEKTLFLSVVYILNAKKFSIDFCELTDFHMVTMYSNPSWVISLADFIQNNSKSHVFIDN